MEFAPIHFSDKVHLTGYGPGRFQLSGEEIVEGSLMLLPEGLARWAARSITDMTETDAEAIAAQAQGFDILLIGTGEAIAPLPKAVRLAFESRDVGYDLMDTGAACRTFNVLLAEERRVAAVLIAYPEQA